MKHHPDKHHPDKQTKRFLSAPCYLPDAPLCLQTCPAGNSGLEPSPKSQCTPRLPPASLLGAQLLCLGHSALAGSTGPQPRTLTLVPNPSLTPGTALEEFSAFHGHQLCMEDGIPQLCLCPRSFIQSNSRSNLLWRDVNPTLSPAPVRFRKLPVSIKQPATGAPHAPCPVQGPGLPRRVPLLQTWVGAGETMHHHSVSAITLRFLPWAGSCFFWKRCRQEISRGLG